MFSKFYLAQKTGNILDEDYGTSIFYVERIYEIQALLTI